jgi:hypothetical protein
MPDADLEERLTRLEAQLALITKLVYALIALLAGAAVGWIALYDFGSGDRVGIGDQTRTVTEVTRGKICLPSLPIIRDTRTGICRGA